jgi:hypothetical protein
MTTCRSSWVGSTRMIRTICAQGLAVGVKRAGSAAARAALTGRWVTGKAPGPRHAESPPARPRAGKTREEVKATLKSERAKMPRRRLTNRRRTVGWGAAVGSRLRDAWARKQPVQRFGHARLGRRASCRHMRLRSYILNEPPHAPSIL